MVDGKETVDLNINQLRSAVREMMTYAWDLEDAVIPDILEFLVTRTGEYYDLIYGKHSSDSVEVSKYVHSETNYLVYINVPTKSLLLVCEVICSTTKLTKQEEWSNEKHCTKKYLGITQKMLMNLEDISDLQWIFCRIMESLGHPEEPIHCGCCGDTIYSYDLEI